LIRRKAAIGLCLAVGVRSLSLTLAAHAQGAPRTFLIGILSQGKRYPPVVDDLSVRLREIGRAGGFTVKFEERWADDRWQALPVLAAELVALRVDLIIANGDTPTVTAAAGATRTTPIVFLWVSDPVGQGLVRNLRQPGGNVTGLSILGPEMELKRLELLKELAPKITRIAVVTNSAANDLAAPLRQLQSASQSLGVQLSLFDVRAPSDLTKALEQMALAHVHGILVQDDYMLNLLIQQVAAFALKHRLPLAAEGMLDGVLVAYRFDWNDHFLRASRLIGKILNGANPGDLPVEQPTRFELAINSKTANDLGLPIPRSILMRADRVLR
jgi:putative tryptophan/tyrosine transport system substrate-binding protein